MAVYVRRRGRFTHGQKRALETLSERFLLQEGTLNGWLTAEPASAELGVEIGFGMGQALLAWAQRAPDWRLLGAEVYQPGIGSLLLQLEANELGNVRVMDVDAELLVSELLPPSSVSEFRILFPDPWPKKRHAKRRLIQPAFAQQLVRCLRPRGVVRLATDWEPYADWMLEVMSATAGLRNLAPASGFVPAGTARPGTRFEDRGLRLGHEIWDLAFEKLP